MQFWAKKEVKIKRKWDNFLKFSGTNLGFGDRLWSKKRGWGRLGGRAKFSPPGGPPEKTLYLAFVGPLKVVTADLIMPRLRHSCIEYLTLHTSNFSIFNSKLFFLACNNIFFTKKVVFCHFLKKSAFLVNFDIKNGFSDSFPLQKCILLYTSQL